MTQLPSLPYPDLAPVLDELVASLRKLLGDDFVGAYLQGSLAVGDFDAHSDVDFIVVTKSELASRQVEALQRMHERIYSLDAHWAKHLEGSYFPRAVLHDHEQRGSDLWYLDHGARRLVRSSHCNTVVVRWVVREQGISLTGPPPATLVRAIPQAALRAEIFETMTTWGEEILADPTPWANRFDQGFIVLNYSRMLHDLQRGRPGSKRQGAEWAKVTLGSSWAPLIDAAWETRPDPARQVREPADPEAFAQTLRFLKFVLDESRRFMGGERHADSGGT